MAQSRPKKKSAPKKNTMKAPQTPKKLPEKLDYYSGLTVVLLADQLSRPVTDVIKRLMKLGVMANQNQPLDRDVVELIALEYGIPLEDKVDISTPYHDVHFIITKVLQFIIQCV